MVDGDIGIATFPSEVDAIIGKLPSSRVTIDVDPATEILSGIDGATIGITERLLAVPSFQELRLIDSTTDAMSRVVDGWSGSGIELFVCDGNMSLESGSCDCKPPSFCTTIDEY